LITINTNEKKSNIDTEVIDFDMIVKMHLDILHYDTIFCLKIQKAKQFFI